MRFDRGMKSSGCFLLTTQNQAIELWFNMEFLPLTPLLHHRVGPLMQSEDFGLSGACQ